jgi:hypothetical protein
VRRVAELGSLGYDTDMDRLHTPIARVDQPGSVKLFTEKGTAVATGIGGPLAGTYLIAKNFRSLGKERAATLTLMIGGALTIALFTTLTLLPLRVVEKVPREFIPLGMGVIGYLVINSLQRKEIDAHLQTGGKKGSWHMIVGSGLVSAALSLGYCFALGELVPSQEQIFDGTPYKFETTGATMYYDKATIGEADIKFVGRQLEEMGYFSKENPLPAGFRKEGDKYTIEILLDEQKWNGSDVQHDTQLLLKTLKDWHPDRDFQVRFVDVDWIQGRKSRIFRGMD